MEPTSSFNLSAASLSTDLAALLAVLSAIAFSFGSWVFVGCTETIEVEGDHEGILSSRDGVSCKGYVTRVTWRVTWFA
jgi:hypothetical protein